MTTKICRVCQCEKPLSAFKKRLTGSYRLECYDCQRALNVARYEAQKAGTYKRERKPKRGKRVFFRMAYTAATRDKAENVRAFDLWKLARKQKLRCAYTGEKLTKENISLDHKTPIFRGGTNAIENLQLVCYDVNLAKNFMLENDFIHMCHAIAKRFPAPAENHRRGAQKAASAPICAPALAA